MNKSKVIVISLSTGIIVGIICVLISIWSNKPSKIRIGYSPLLINMPIMVASENNYFDSLGLDVELIQMSSTNNMRDAVTNTYSGAYPPINSGRIKSARAAIKSVIPADMHPF